MGGNNSEDHLRQRKIIAPAFTERAVKRQEGIVSSYIDLLINGLRKRIETDGGKTVVDVVDWYSWTTFDIIGDLSFGASFDCLKNARFHPFVAEIFNKWKSLSLLGSIRRYPPLDRLTPFFYGSMIQARLDHFEWARQRVEKRMNLEMVRPDFMTEMMKNNDEKTMTVPEVETLAHGIISAGSETTATLLSGATNYLLKYPDTLKRLQDEIRSKFSDDAAIDLASVGNLPYLNAVLEESLRMCTPVGGGLPRTVPTGGDTVCGHFLEEGTEVSFHHWAAYRSSKHFAHPNEFHPERWLNSSDEFSKDKKTSLKPFSIGSHSCAGQNLAWAEMRLILARMVLNFDFAIPEEFGAPLEWDSQKVYILWEKKPNRVQLKIAKF
ncbi:hypothetical protein MMC20_001011 [Loxospora ochrophaea]|nr:hypothetical protein [Loxospora ochrophaea]